MKSKIEEICKSEEWNEFLCNIKRLVESKYLRQEEYILSVTPYEYGIQVILRGKNIVHQTPWREMVGENPPPKEYITFKTRTIHIWWREFYRFKTEKYENNT